MGCLSGKGRHCYNVEVSDNSEEIRAPIIPAQSVRSLILSATNIKWDVHMNELRFRKHASCIHYCINKWRTSPRPHPADLKQSNGALRQPALPLDPQRLGKVFFTGVSATCTNTAATLISVIHTTITLIIRCSICHDKSYSSYSSPVTQLIKVIR